MSVEPDPSSWFCRRSIGRCRSALLLMSVACDHPPALDRARGAGRAGPAAGLDRAAGEAAAKRVSSARRNRPSRSIIRSFDVIAFRRRARHAGCAKMREIFARHPERPSRVLLSTARFAASPKVDNLYRALHAGRDTT